MRTSPSYTASYRLEVDEANLSVSQIVDAVSATGAQIKGLDVADSDRGRIVIDLTCDMRDSEHRREVEKVLDDLEGVHTFRGRPDLHGPRRRQDRGEAQGSSA